MFSRKYLMLSAAFIVTASCGVSLAQTSASAPASTPVTLRPIKAGDKYTFQRTMYLQETKGGEVTLSNAPGKPVGVSVQSDDAQGRSLKFSNGVEVYDSKNGYVAWIDSQGTRKDFSPDKVLHWMPEGGLKPGMEWKISQEYETVGTSYGGQCTMALTYKATSKPTTREVTINDAKVTLNAIEVRLQGRLKSISSCKLNAGEQDIVRTFVYSPELNLVIEKSKLAINDFKDMIGKDNNVEAVTSIKLN